MDEPFGALDALTREQMRIDLEELWLARRKTVVFITHSVDEAVLLADRVVVMSPRPGRIERVVEVDLARPRGLAGRKHRGFEEATDLITEIFLAGGVLHGSQGGIDLILICNTDSEAQAFHDVPAELTVLAQIERGEPPDYQIMPEEPASDRTTFHTRLQEGSLPGWLTPIELPPDLAPFKLFRVVPPRQ